MFHPLRIRELLESKEKLYGNYDFIFGSHSTTAPVVKEIADLLNLPSGVMLLDIPTDLIMADPQREFYWNMWFPYLKKVNLVITNTKVAREEFIKFTGRFIPEENVIPYGINILEDFDKRGLNVKGDYVISVCRLTDKKNCILIPKALNKLDIGLGYVAVGRDSGQLKAIKNYCEENNVEFKHYPLISERDKFTLIENSSMLIYPQDSEYIGGLSPFEAMYCGKPAIVPYLKVLIDLYGDSAFYFKNNDEYDLANVISIIHSYKRSILKSRLLSANAYAKQEALYPIMAKRLMDLLEKELTK
jgi:glycosyltransferase involved in cell wall biosynthesis